MLQNFFLILAGQYVFEHEQSSSSENTVQNYPLCEAAPVQATGFSPCEMRWEDEEIWRKFQMHKSYLIPIPNNPLGSLH